MVRIATETSKSEIQLIITGNHQSATTSLDTVAKAVTAIGESVGKVVTKISDLGSSLVKLGEDAIKAKEGLSGANKQVSNVGKSVTKAATDVSTNTSKFADGLTKVSTDANKMADQVVADFGRIKRESESLGKAINPMTSAYAAQTDRMRANTAATRAQASATKQSHHDNMMALIGTQMLGFGLQQTGMQGAKLFVGAIDQAAQYQAMMSRVQAALYSTGGASKQQIQDLGTLMQDLSMKSLYSSTDIATAAQNLAKQGMGIKDILNGGIQSVVTLSQATDSSLADTATVLTDIQHEYGLSGNQLINVTNGISGAMHTSSISMKDFYNTMKYAGPNASQLGASVNGVSTAIGLLAQHGIKGSQAGTTLRRMFLNLQPHTKAATAEMKDLGMMTKNGTSIFFDSTGHMKSLDNVISLLHDHLAKLNPIQRQTALNTIFGTYALSGMQVIARTTGRQWETLTKQMSNVTAQRVAAEKMNNVAAQAHILQSSVDTLGQNMATFLLPSVNSVIQGLIQLVNWVMKLPSPVQHAMLITLGLGSGLLLISGYILNIVSSIFFLREFKVFETIGGWVTGAASKIKTLFIPAVGEMAVGEEAAGAASSAMLGPWGLLIAGVVAGVILLIANWKSITTWLKKNFGIDVPALLNSLGKVFSDVWNGMKSTINAVWKYIGPQIIDGIKAVQKWWKEIFPDLSTVFKAIWNGIKTFVSITAIPIFLAISAAVGALRKSWKDIWNGIRDTFKTVWDALSSIVKVDWDIISGIIKVILDLMTGHWQKAWNDSKDTVIKVWNDMKDGIKKVVDDLGRVVMDAVNGLIDGVTGAFSGLLKSAQTIWNGILGVFGQKVPSPSMPSVPTHTATSAAARKIPHFASGGLVTKPTIALVGESGPEMVVPLNGINQSSSNYRVGLPASMQSSIGTGGNGRVVNVYIQSIVIPKGDEKTIGTTLKQQLKYALS